MLEIARKRGPFLFKEIWFSPRPFTITGCDSVIFKNCRDLVSLSGFEVEVSATSVIDLLQDIDTLWKNLNSGCRKEIRSAERSGVSVETSKDFEEFYSIYRSFAKQKALTAWFSKRAFIHYVKNGVLFAAKLDGRTLNDHLYFHDGQQMRWIMAPSRRFERDRSSTSPPPQLVGHANRLTVWEAIKYAKNAGMAIFDLGGIYTGPNDSDPRHRITQFKREFGGKPATVFNYQMCSSNALRVAMAIQRLLH
jgi:hypothetical protein